jgi:hypothetical protein
VAVQSRLTRVDFGGAIAKKEERWQMRRSLDNLNISTVVVHKLSSSRITSNELVSPLRLLHCALLTCAAFTSISRVHAHALHLAVSTHNHGRSSSRIHTFRRDQRAK